MIIIDSIRKQAATGARRTVREPRTIAKILTTMRGLRWLEGVQETGFGGALRPDSGRGADCMHGRRVDD